MVSEEMQSAPTQQHPPLPHGLSKPQKDTAAQQTEGLGSSGVPLPAVADQAGVHAEVETVHMRPLRRSRAIESLRCESESGDSGAIGLRLSSEKALGKGNDDADNDFPSSSSSSLGALVMRAESIPADSQTYSPSKEDIDALSDAMSIFMTTSRTAAEPEEDPESDDPASYWNNYSQQKSMNRQAVIWTPRPIVPLHMRYCGINPRPVVRPDLGASDSDSDESVEIVTGMDSL